MLIALDDFDDRVEGKDASRGESYTCPACRAPVTLKRGAIVIPHFAHQPRSTCLFAKGESQRHLEMKSQVGAWLRSAGQTFEYESMFGTVHRADVVSGRIVIECQSSPLSIDDWEERTRFYNRTGFSVLWIWDLLRMLHSPHDLDYGEFRIPAEIRHCHQMSYGRIYTMDDYGQIRDCHFSSIYRPPGDWDEATGYYPKSVRTYEHRLSALHSKIKFGPRGHRLVWLDHDIWWKR